MPTRDELFAYVKATFGTEPDYLKSRNMPY